MTNFLYSVVLTSLILVLLSIWAKEDMYRGFEQKTKMELKYAIQSYIENEEGFELYSEVQAQMTANGISNITFEPDLLPDDFDSKSEEAGKIYLKAYLEHILDLNKEPDH